MRLSFLSFLLATIQLAYSTSERDHFDENSSVILLNDTIFDNVTRIGNATNTTKPWFIMFYASWCPHCKRIIPLWEQVAEKYNQSVNLGAMECDENPDVKDMIGVQGYPTLMFFPSDNKMYKYASHRNMENISDFIDNELWRKQEGEEIPTEFSQMRKIGKIIMSPIFIISFIVFVIVLLLVGVTLDELRNSRKNKVDTNKQEDDMRRSSFISQQQRPKRE